MTRILLLYALIAISISANGQSPNRKNILLEFKGKQDNERKTIMDKLKVLEDASTQTLLFNTVKTVEQHKKETATLLKIRELIEEKEDGDAIYFINDSTARQNEELINQLLQYDYYLYIQVSETNTFQDRQNFRFDLYRVIPGVPATKTQPGQLPSFIFLKDEEKEIRQLDNRELLVHNTIQKLFPQSNLPPIAKISVNKHLKEDKVYFLSEGDSLLVDATASSDLDTYRKHFKYKWQQFNGKDNINVPTAHALHLQTNTIQQFIYPPEIGTYIIGLSIDDGITQSAMDSLYINVIETPKLIPQKKVYARSKKASFFQFILNKRTYQRIHQDHVNFNLENYAGPFQLNASIKKKKLRNQKIQPQVEIFTIDSIHHQLQIQSPLNYKDTLSIILQGNYQNVLSNTAEYQLIHPGRDFFKINFGTELFAGPSILGISSDSIGLFHPSFSAQAGVYLWHFDYPEGHLLFESGIQWFPTQIGEQINENRIAGKLALKGQASLNELLGVYCSLQLLGFPQQLSNNQFSSSKHYGFGIGFAIKPLHLEVDLINIYHNFQNDGLSLSNGLRIDLGGIVHRGINRLLEN